ncbi:Fic family protein [Veillonella sp. R32]|uniref:Fic family protein n=1 Tax=Veillonella sp. R32 TaxID=2021312 RepID=UPI00138943D2|nr:Fic family protein [Veillonella sp. R32]KAF1682286.1 cell filamentation protein Fic [Veillonella sp. R32]
MKESTIIKEFTNDYLADLAVRMAHHSTAIEGNTLSLGETKSIIVDNYIPKAMNEREYYEVRNYRNYMPYLINNINNEITIDVIKETHAILLDNLRDDKGQFKVSQNAILGAMFEPTKPYLVTSELKNSLDNLYFRLENTNIEDKKIEAIMDFHYVFERIHPFPDGNGRTGRALIVHACIQNDIPPIVITKENRDVYINALNTDNKQALYEFAKAAKNYEKIRIEQFSNS